MCQGVDTCFISCHLTQLVTHQLVKHLFQRKNDPRLLVICGVCLPTGHPQIFCHSPIHLKMNEPSAFPSVCFARWRCLLNGVPDCQEGGSQTTPQDRVLASLEREDPKSVPSKRHLTGRAHWRKCSGLIQTQLSKGGGTAPFYSHAPPKTYVPLF